MWTCHSPRTASRRTSTRCSTEPSGPRSLREVQPDLPEELEGPAGLSGDEVQLPWEGLSGKVKQVEERLTEKLEKLSKQDVKQSKQYEELRAENAGLKEQLAKQDEQLSKQDEKLNEVLRLLRPGAVRPR